MLQQAHKQPGGVIPPGCVMFGSPDFRAEVLPENHV
jgi:hypothetical protein